MRLVIGIDGSDTTLHLTAQCLAAVHPPSSPDLEVFLISVLPPPMLNVLAPTPVATAAAVSAVVAAQQHQEQEDEARAQEVLGAARRACIDAGVARQHIHTHVLPAAGGASGVGESLVEFVKAQQVDLVALGSRGMGGFKRSLMSLVGLGSVSTYCTHNLAVPVMVVRPAAAAGSTNGSAAAADKPRTVVLAIDDSPHSSHALDWTVSHLAHPQDEVHCVVVALPVPYPILDESSAAVAALEAQEWQHSSERNFAYARELASRAAAAAVASGKVERGRAVAEALVPEGGASDVGAAIVKYAKRQQADLVVVGSRGMGSWKRSVMSFVGLGSVSDYAIDNLSCPVVVVKTHEAALPKQAAHAAGAAAAAVAASPEPAAAGKRA